MNWTGQVVAAPRSELAALLTRPETSRTGIYTLLGEDLDSLGGLLAQAYLDLLIERCGTEGGFKRLIGRDPTVKGGGSPLRGSL